MNTAAPHYHPDGFPNDIQDSSTWTTELFQPSVKITKTGPAKPKARDTPTPYTTLFRSSSADSPDLIFDSFSDSLVAGVTPPGSCDDLAPGESCSFSYSYTVHAGDPDPLSNTATVHYHPDGFPNDIHDASTWTTELFQPS